MRHEMGADFDTGELRPIALIKDNGPALKATRFARFIDSHAGAHETLGRDQHPDRTVRYRVTR